MECGVRADGAIATLSQYRVILSAITSPACR